MKVRLLFLLFVLPLAMLAQNEPKKIEIVQAKSMKGSQRGGLNMSRLLGDVQLKHEGMLLTSDSAHFFPGSNALIAYGRVHINQGDTFHLYGDVLNYSGNTKIAVMEGNVRLQDPKVNLTTPSLRFDRNLNMGYYTEGANIITDEQQLKSRTGTYDGNSKRLLFKKEVELIHPEYTIWCDTMVHYTESEQTWFFGPTHIVGSNGDIRCNRGFFDALRETSWFADSVIILNQGQEIRGDSVEYNQRTDEGQVYGHVWLIDTADGYTVTGQYARYRQANDYAFVTGFPVYSLDVDGDTLHLTGDTLLTYRVNDTAERFLRVYRDVRIFKTDFQGRCDSLVYLEEDSVFHLYRDPVLWNGVNQMTSDFMRLTMRNGNMDSLVMTGNAFMMSRTETVLFDQIKGRNMTGIFNDNKLDVIYVNGNGQTVYNAYNEEDKLIGVNRADCSNLEIYVDENKVRRIVFLVKPKATLYPMDDVPEGEKKLKGFKSRYSERPEHKDIFR